MNNRYNIVYWLATVCFAVLLLPDIGFASDPLSFCGSESCISGEVSNASGVEVVSVNVEQKQNTNRGCESDTQKHSENLGNQDSFGLMLDINCEYLVKFKTSKSCISHKFGTITRDDMKSEKTSVALVGDCGTLRVHVE